MPYYPAEKLYYRNTKLSADMAVTVAHYRSSANDSRFRLSLLLVLLSLLFSFSFSHAQVHTVSGKVTNASLEPLAYVSVRLKEVKQGTLTDEKGFFSMQLEEGRYEIVFSIVGFKIRTIPLVVGRGNVTQNIILENDIHSLGDIQVSAQKRDRAEEYVRNVIKNKEQVLLHTSTYSCKAYIRATQEIIQLKKLRSVIADSMRKANEGLSNMSMAEVVLKLDYEYPSHIKEERQGVQLRGNSESLFFLTTTDGDFNFYRNLVKVKGISAMPFLSPISYSGLIAYHFKTIHSKKEAIGLVHTIRVTPIKLGNALVEGEMDILDSTWVILRTHFSFPKYHMPEYDAFSVDQQYALIQDKAWLPVRQQFTYSSKEGKGKLSGNTVAVFKDYAVDTGFARKHFSVEISSTAQEAYERDSSFWNRERAEPLTDKEVKFIRYKDSVRLAITSKKYLDSVDAETNRINAKRILLDGVTFYNRAKERNIYVAPLAAIYEPFQLGGGRIAYEMSYSKTFRSRKNIRLFSYINYGLRNKDLKGTLSIEKLYNPFNRGFYRVEAGRDFAYIFEGDAWINVLKRSNIYQATHLTIQHGLELSNGLFLTNEIEMSARRSVADYKLNHKIDSVFGDILTNNNPVDFPSYNAFYNTVTLAYTPQQRYIREPKEKIILGSNWPTFYATWRKGLPGVFNSVIDFDYVELGMKQQIPLGLLGITNYTFFTGSFLSKRDLRLVDYKFMRQGDPALFQNPTKSFQALDSTFPVFNRYYEGHLLHQFNGAIINKIPLLKKLNVLEVGGAGILYAPERNLTYAEVFFGLEKIFRFWRDRYKFGLYIVGSTANRFNNPLQFKFGLEIFNRRKNSWY
jgi:hypothetical protein